MKTWTVPGLGIQSYGLVRDLSPTYSYNRQRCHERINIPTCNPLGFQVREWDKISVIYLALESIQGYFNLESIFGYKHRNNAFDKTLTHSDELTYQERIFYTSGEFLWNQEVAHIPCILRQLSLAYSLVLYQSHIYSKPVEPLVIGNTTVSNTLHATIPIHSTYTNQHWERKGIQIDNAVIYLSRAMIILYAPCFLTSLCRAVSPSSSWAETSAPA